MDHLSTLRFPLLILKLVLGTVLFSCIGYIIGNNPFQFSDLFLDFVLSSIITIAFILMVTFKLYSKRIFEINYWREIVLTLALISTAILFSKIQFSYYEIHYWIAVSLWVALGLITVTLEKNFSTTKKALFFLSHTWTISFFFISLGQFPFKYSIFPLQSLWTIHFLLDIRFTIGLSVLIFSLIYSAIKVREEKDIYVENLIVRETENELAQNILQVLNTLWRVFCHPIKFLFHVGIEMKNIYAEMFKNWKHLLVYIGYFLLAIIGLFLSMEISPYLRKHITDLNWTLNFMPLVYSLLFLIAITACLIGMYYLQSLSSENGKLIRNKEYFSGNLVLVINETPNLILFILFSGWILFAIARLIPHLNFIGFNVPGILTSILSSVIVLGLGYGIVTKKTISKIQDQLKFMPKIHPLKNEDEVRNEEESKDKIKTIVN